MHVIYTGSTSVVDIYIFPIHTEIGYRISFRWANPKHMITFYYRIFNSYVGLGFVMSDLNRSCKVIGSERLENPSKNYANF